MKYGFIFIFILFIKTPPAFSKGQDLGSGGDLVLCQKSQENSLEGFYSLDYLIAVSHKPFDIYEPSSLENSFSRIEKNLKEKVPELWASFHDFRMSLFKSDFLSTRIWEAAPYQLIELTDEELGTTDRIPENCKGDKGVRTSQAVIHLAPGYSGAGPGVTMYRFMPKIIDELSLTRPLQISFLLIHEWLWDHSSIVDRNRRLNNFFHSKDFDRLSRTEILTLLGRLGLSIPLINYGAFNPHFYAFSCQNGLDNLNGMIRAQGENEWNFLNEKSARYYRERLCTSQGCSPWSLYNEEQKFPTKTYLHLSSLAKKIIFSNSKDYYPPMNELVCYISGRALECTTADTKQVVIGTASDNCLRVERFDSQNVPGKPEEWIESQTTYDTRYDGLTK